MTLQIYNSFTRQKEEFKPITAGKINMYACGVTVYDYSHIGHARMYVVMDVVARFLKWSGYELNYVRNFTDIDDKIIARANENKEDYTALTKRFIDAYHEDMNALNLMSPNHEPCATDHINEMISLIQTLLEKEIAYVGENGDVYYDVSKFKPYGCLAHRDLDGLQAGARVDVMDSKRNPLDFVLWKMAKPDEPKWPSPWGEGRPGWHIECSAMSMHFLGNTFDIHGGGFDLQFPHHENEIAQSEAATGEKFANYWMHVGFLAINEEKMSKSLGNFFTVREVLKSYPAEVVRYFLLSSHYRSQLNYSTDNLTIARTALERFYTALRDLPELDERAAELADDTYPARFRDCMNDDFNTPEALAVLFEMTHKINSLKQNEPEKAAQLAKQLRDLGAVLGVLQESTEEFFQSGFDDQTVEKIDGLIAERKAARAEKNWQRADEIRDELHAMGIEIEDGAGATTWRRASSVE